MVMHLSTEYPAEGQGNIPHMAYAEALFRLFSGLQIRFRQFLHIRPFTLTVLLRSPFPTVAARSVSSASHARIEGNTAVRHSSQK